MIDPECDSCGEESDEFCPESKRPCRHHCNHVWSHGECCWCKKEFGEESTEPVTVLIAEAQQFCDAMKAGANTHPDRTPPYGALIVLSFYGPEAAELVAQEIRHKIGTGAAVIIPDQPPARKIDAMPLQDEPDPQIDGGLPFTRADAEQCFAIADYAEGEIAGDA